MVEPLVGASTYFLTGKNVTSAFRVWLVTDFPRIVHVRVHANPTVGQFISSASNLNADYGAVATVTGSGQSLTATCAMVTPSFGTCSWNGPGVLTRQTDGSAVLTDGATFKIVGTWFSNCTQLRWSNGDVWDLADTTIARVHVVFMTHLDVGYTLPSIDAVIEVCARRR